MATPYIGEIRMFAGNFAPAGWNFCDGTLLSIAANSALFTLLGTTYGGDGQNTFALPDLRGRIPLHQGTSTQGTYVQGQKAGEETVTLTTQQIPSHQHPVNATTLALTGLTASPAGAVWTRWMGAGYTSKLGTLNQMSADAIANSSGDQPHDNLPPFVVISFIIALEGIYPTSS